MIYGTFSVVQMSKINLISERPAPILYIYIIIIHQLVDWIYVLIDMNEILNLILLTQI